MDQKELRRHELKCVQENPPGCTAGCPVHVDVRGLMGALQEGDMKAGGALFHKVVPFPGVISRICHAPCQSSCKRREIDESISINALERICMEHYTTQAKFTVASVKESKVAVVGAGLSGLTVAFDLLRKGYQVTIFEASDHLGGSLWDIQEEVLPREVIAKDFAVFAELAADVRYNTFFGKEVTLDLLCAEYAAVYLGLGCQAIVDLPLERQENGRVLLDAVTRMTSRAGVFAGGGLWRGCEDHSAIFSISDGRIAAISIDRFLQQVSLTANREKEGPYQSTLYTNIQEVEPQPRVLQSKANGFSREEAEREAKRCLLCECRECVKACEYLKHYGSYPKRYVREIYNNLSIVMGIHHANKLINSCNLCGRCSEVCPGNLNMGEICHEARQMMVEKGKMPPSAHDFALRDMEFSNSEKFMLKRHQPGFTASKTVFFPSCQLAASQPYYIKPIYEFLCEKIAGGVGLWLGCCGAPASWAGQEGLFGQTIKEWENSWRAMGQPDIITACPSCFYMFKNHLPDLPIEMLWTLLDRIGLPEGKNSASQKFAVHDSCMTRYESALHQSVRSILYKKGQQIEELPDTKEHTVCCGYGGLMIYANREVAHKVINRRIGQSETPYLTYCAMCHDNFLSHDKTTYHLLDLLFGEAPQEKVPGYSQRQENRAKLKTMLLEEVWGESVVKEAEYKLIIPETFAAVLEERMILADDIRKVIAYAEKTGDKLQDSATGHYIAYFKPVRVTYWVEYSTEKNGFLVHNAYSHRLEISG